MIELSVRQSAGDFLKVMILDERGLTQKWLAKEVGCAERKISEICNGKRGISIMLVKKRHSIFLNKKIPAETII